MIKGATFVAPFIHDVTCKGGQSSAASLSTRWPPTDSSPFSTEILTVSPSFILP